MSGSESFRGLLLRLRGRTQFSQSQLAERAGVHLRSLQGWEAGNSFPSTERLQALIVALLQSGAFTAGGESAEAEALWSAVEREASRQHPPYDHAWFEHLMVGPSTSTPTAVRPPHSQPRSIENVAEARAQDWGEAPDSVAFLGRQSELQALTALCSRNGARLLVLSGMGGIGKTTLAARLSRSISGEFHRVYWRSMRDAPPFSDWSGGAIGFLADHQGVAPEGDAARTEALLELMRARRCLIVLDNLEALLLPGRHDGSFRPEYSGFATFLSAAADRSHDSVVLITSREVPLLLMQTAARVVEIGGLELADAKLLLADKGLTGEEHAWTELVSRYGGNALGLRVVGEAVRNVFGGDIASFMEQVPAGTVFSGIRRLLDTQFVRLSPVEVEILQLLAIAREPLSFSVIASELARRGSRSVVLEAIEALRHRSLIASSASSGGFTLQSVVLEYVTDQLVERAVTEIEQGQLDALAKRPLIKAQAKDYVRRAQEVMIGQPLVERLNGASRDSWVGSGESRLLSLLDELRLRDPFDQGYAPGNLLNLLRLLRGDLRGLDFSGLSIHQAYLQDVEAQEADFAGAALIDAVLDDSFGTVSSVAISADGQRFAAGTLAGAVRVWRMSDRTLILSARGHRAAIWGLALSSDGQQLASGGLDGTMRLWNITNGDDVTLTDAESGGIARVLLSMDGQLLASAGLNGKIRLWNVFSCEPIADLDGHDGAVYGLALSADGRVLASGGLDGSVRIWDIENRQQLLKLSGHDGAVWSVALSANGAVAASGGRDGSVRLWNTSTGDPLAMLDGHVGAVRNVDLSADAQIVASGGFDGTVRIWDASTRRRRATLQGHAGGVRGVALTGDGQTIVSGGFDSTVKLWEAQTGLLSATLLGQPGGVRGVALSNDGRLLAGSGPEATIRVWDIDSGRVVAKLHGHTGAVRGVAMGGDRVLVSSGLDNSVRLWDARTGRALGVLHGHAAGVLAVAVAADGHIVASASLDGTVRLWDARIARCISVLEGHTGAVWGVAMTPSGDVVASCGVDGVRVWSVDSGRQLLHFEGHRGGVRSVAISVDGRKIVTGGDDARVRVWVTDSGESTASLSGHTAAVYGVSISPDAITAASGSFDGTVALWDLRDGRALAVLEGHTDAVYDVAISGDGRTLASGSLDGTVRVWDATSFALTHTLRPDRSYERMDITGLSGITDAQRAVLVGMGAVDHARPAQDDNAYPSAALRR